MVFKYTQSDYTIESNFPLPVKLLQYFPGEIKPILNDKSWFYFFNFSPLGDKVPVSRQSLHNRVLEGKILAFQYSLCEPVPFNYAAYIGFVPARDSFLENNDYGQVHRLPIIGSLKVWPRQLLLKVKGNCKKCFCKSSDTNTGGGVGSSISTDDSRSSDRECFLVCFEYRDSTTHYGCIQNIAWDKVYLEMGEYDKSVSDQTSKSLRNCSICAQCYSCSRLPYTFCRKHKTCKHKIKIVLEPDSLTESSTSMKACKKIKLL